MGNIAGGRVVWNLDIDPSAFDKGLDSARAKISNFGSTMGAVTKDGRNAFSGLSGAVDSLVGTTNGLANIAKSLGSNFSTLGSNVAVIGRTLSSTASLIGSDFVDLGKIIGNALVDGLATAGAAIGNFASNIGGALASTKVVAGALNVISDVAGVLERSVSAAGEAITSIWDRLTGVIVTASNRVINVLQSIQSAISGFVSRVETSIKGTVNSILSYVQRLGQAITQTAAFQGVAGVASKAADIFSAGISKAGSVLSAVGGQIARLGPPLVAVASSLGPIIPAAAGVATSIGKIGWNVAQAGATALTEAVRLVGQGAIAASSQIGRLAIEAGKLAFEGVQRIAVGAGSALVALGGAGIKSASQLQGLQISMNGLTHSMSLGAQAMAGAFEFAQKAPFQLPEVAGTTKTLIAYGLSAKDAVNSLELLGNVSITSGLDIQSIGSIFGQVSAQGKLMLGDIRQLTQNGVAILPALQKEFGKTAEQVQEMATNGDISFDQFRKALASLVDPTILDQLTNTMPRQIDRLKGSVRQLSNAFVGVSVDATNGFQVASAGLDQAATTLVKTIADTLRSPELKAAAAQVGAGLVPILNGLAAVIPPIANAIASLATHFSQLGSFALPVLGLIAGSFSGLASGIPVIGGLLGGLSGPMGIFIGLIATLLTQSPELRKALSDAFQSIAGVIKGLAPVFNQLTGIFTEIFKTVGAALGPVIGALAEAFGMILKALLPLLPVFAQLFLTILKEVVVPILPFVVQLINIFAQVVTVLLRALAPLLPVIGQIFGVLFKQVVLPILPILVQFITLVAQAFTLILTALAPLLPSILQLAVVLLTALAPVLPQLVELFVQLVQALLPLLPPLLQLITILLPPLISIITVLANILSSVLVIAVTIAVQIIGLLITIFHGLVDVVVIVISWFDRLLQAAKDKFSGLWNAAGSAVGALINIFKSIPGEIISVFGDAEKILLDIGSKIIHGLINGIKGGFKEVKDTLGDLTHKITDWKGPASVDKRLLIPNANDIMGGFVKGLEQNYNSVRDSMQGLTSSLSSNIDVNATDVISTPNTGNLSSNGAVINPTYNVYNQVDLTQGLRDLAWQLAN